MSIVHASCSLDAVPVAFRSILCICDPRSFCSKVYAAPTVYRGMHWQKIQFETIIIPKWNVWYWWCDVRRIFYPGIDFELSLGRFLELVFLFVQLVGRLFPFIPLSVYYLFVCYVVYMYCVYTREYRKPLSYICSWNAVGRLRRSDRPHNTKENGTVVSRVIIDILMMSKASYKPAQMILQPFHLLVCIRILCACEWFGFPQSAHFYQFFWVRFFLRVRFLDVFVFHFKCRLLQLAINAPIR